MTYDQRCRDDPQRPKRVWSIIEAARLIADQTDPLGIEARRRLPQTSGLSPQGVQLALSRHLEIRPDPKHVRRLIEGAEAAPRCWVLLTANVCTAALRALVWATATAPRVFVRASSRDPVLAELLVRQLQHSDPFAVKGASISLSADLRPQSGDMIHLYGSDETVAEIRANLPPGVIVRAHGTGFGFAVVDAPVALGPAAAALAEDIVPFDQRGCLSPRFALVEGDSSRAEAFANELDRALDARGQTISRGTLAATERGELTRYQRTMEAVGRYFAGRHHGIGVDPAPTGLYLPPALRCLHVIPTKDADIARLLHPWLRYVTAIGSARSDGQLSGKLHTLAPRARFSELGGMQLPPLDGPVDQRCGW